MRKAAASVLGLILFVSVSTGQDEAPEQKIEIIPSGETVYDFSIEVKLAPPVSQSSARALVDSWCLMMDNRDSTSEVGKAAMSKYEELRAAELKRLGALLLADTGEEKKDAKEEESSFQSTRGPSEITEEVTQEDGSVLITTKQTRESKFRGRDGEWETSTRESYMRFQCVQREGKWLINNIEDGRVDSKDEETPEISWRANRGGVLEIAYELGDGKLVEPEIKTGSETEAALSLMTLRDFHTDSDWHAMIVAAGALAKVGEPLLTEEWKSKVKKGIEDRKARKKSDDPPLKVKETRKEDGGVVVIFEKTDSKTGYQWVVKVVKQGESWRVRELGKLYDAGTPEESYKAVDNVFGR